MGNVVEIIRRAANPSFLSLERVTVHTAFTAFFFVFYVYRARAFRLCYALQFVRAVWWGGFWREVSN